MPDKRNESNFEKNITSEIAFLRELLNKGFDFPLVQSLGEPLFRNPHSENKLGKYRSLNARKLVTTDWNIINENKNKLPCFLEAGPREFLFYSPDKVRAAIVTTGGVAPGLNCVIHGIVNRHYKAYDVNEALEGGVFGVYESFLGLCDLEQYMKPLTPSETEAWIDKGGSMLGIRRFHDKSKEELADIAIKQLTQKKINILYVIGGDGSLVMAHEIAKKAKDISVVGIPKTMDNDVMWAWQSFGFISAVEKATEVINTLHSEAEATRRVCIIELFGAESGFVAANATLASGHVDLVMIPEEFQPLTKELSELALMKYINYLIDRLYNPPENEKPHAVVVLAEGTAKILADKEVQLGEEAINEKNFGGQLRGYLEGKVKDKSGRSIDIFDNQPRHHIRAIPPNAQDKIYCERLGALAVDNALAGFSNFMISHWLTEYVLVPLEIVAGLHKKIPTAGNFWKQIVNSTGQPIIS